ncbi:SDR family oxidoreductase [Pokkaliibacter sp. CJK22405]|uniref:SDR family oxidoreductase n=1 Tax=Pokkaliibacter sp. CJK22405 TaxID=3384615 RepID=UPI0039853824
MSASVLLAGLGKLGQALAGQLSQKGYQVHGLCRSPKNLPGVTLHYTDLTDPQVPITLSKVDYVFILLAPGSREEAHYRATYVDGSRRLINALPQVPKHLFFISSTSVYGQQNHEWIDETSETQPASFSGRILLEAEALIHSQPYPTTCLRLSGIYGEGRNHLLNQVREGKIPAREHVHYSNRIHQEDAIGAMQHLLTLAIQGQPLESCYLVTDNEPATLHEVCQWMAEQLGVETVEEGQPRRRGGSKRCCNKRLTDTGYCLRYPDFRKGYTGLTANNLEQKASQNYK